MQNGFTRTRLTFFIEVHLAKSSIASFFLKNTAQTSPGAIFVLMVQNQECCDEINKRKILLSFSNALQSVSITVSF